MAGRRSRSRFATGGSGRAGGADRREADGRRHREAPVLGRLARRPHRPQDVPCRHPECRAARALARGRRPASRVTVSFDRPVRLVDAPRPASRHSHAAVSAPRDRACRSAVVASRSHERDALTVRARRRARGSGCPHRCGCSWFPRRERVQALVAPSATDKPLTPRTERDHADLLPGRVEGNRRRHLPVITPARCPGRWRPSTRTRSHSGRPVSASRSDPTSRCDLPRAVDLASRPGPSSHPHAHLGRPARHDPPPPPAARPDGLPPGRLELLSGRLQCARTPPRSSPRSPTRPPGHFSWPYAATTPKELRGIWRTFEWNEITRGAVMMFEHDHDLEVDAFVGPQVWHALLDDALAGKRRTTGYSYVYVHRNIPSSLTLWHDGKTILHLARQHRRPRGADPARHVPGLRAHPDRDDEPARTRTGRAITIRASAGSATSTTVRRSTRSTARASARRRASVASSSRSRPRRRCGPTRRSGRSSRSRTRG